MSDGWIELGVIFAIAVLIAARHEIRHFLTAPFRAASRRRRLKRERREAERRQREQQQQALARERADTAERQRQLEEIRRALDDL
jgi:Sec-independent protein translocase protein TatA